MKTISSLLLVGALLPIIFGNSRASAGSATWSATPPSNELEYRDQLDPGDDPEWR